MGNVNMPTPVAVAGGALCLLAGYLVGAVAGPDPASRTTAEVKSYDTKSQELCLTGDGIDGKPGAADGELCGVWKRSTGDSTPHEGDDFRFVSVVSKSGSNSATYIYGTVVE
jgi:hypothetical protein